MMRVMVVETAGKSAAEGDGGGYAAHSPARHVGNEHGGDATHDRGQVRGFDNLQILLGFSQTSREPEVALDKHSGGSGPRTRLGEGGVSFGGLSLHLIAQRFPLLVYLQRLTSAHALQSLCEGIGAYDVLRTRKMCS